MTVPRALSRKMHENRSDGMTLPPDLSSTPGIEEYAGRYSPYYRHTDRFICEMLRDAYKRESQNGYMTRDELLMADEWKNGGRHRHRILQNEEGSVFEQSHKAFRNEDIKPLMDLKGIGVATASAIMHFAFHKKYPIIDRYALETLGIGEPQSRNLERYWNDYQKSCCIWAEEYNVDLRTLDRALWQHRLEKSDRRSRCAQKRANGLSAGPFREHTNSTL